MSNLPKEFLEQFSILGFSETEVENFTQSLSEPSPISIRYNPKKISADFKELKRVPWSSDGFYLKSRPNFTADPLLHAGVYYVQEASSMFLEQAIKQTVDLSQKNIVLDLCAAPGGKSTLISGIINEDSFLLSNEVIHSRANILSENVQKWGNHNIAVCSHDPAEISSKLVSFFDLIVVDAPCSGEGMFRKNENSIDEWSSQNIKHCALRQQRILHDIWAALKPGGILIYSTCTYNQNENELNLLKFKNSEDFHSVQLEIKAEWNITETKVEDIYSYRFYPHKTKGEGFFISVLKKEEGPSAKHPKTKKQVFEKLSSELDQINDYCIDISNISFLKKNNKIFAFPSKTIDEIQILEEKLNLIYRGTELAEITNKGIFPLESAAFWHNLNYSNFIVNTFDKENTLKYLRLDTIQVEIIEKKDGYQIILFKNHALGWIKKIQNRVNNYFPKEWKIRMSLERLL
jgi:16S rRNA C967 or C1407 C5-methylase (RsmB/RsmF family)/NOL1/NOP2/fmu family ribosome biogenesis protein